MSVTRRTFKVYVLEADVYDGRYIVGVYASPEDAMAAWKPTHPDDSHSYEWRDGPDEHGMWTFDADWSDAARIYTFEVAT